MKFRMLNDAREFSGETAEEVVRQMKDAAPHNVRLSLKEYMEGVVDWTGDPTLRADSPEEFLRTLEEAGYVSREG